MTDREMRLDGVIQIVELHNKYLGDRGLKAFNGDYFEFKFAEIIRPFWGAGEGRSTSNGYVAAKQDATDFRTFHLILWYLTPPQLPFVIQEKKNQRRGHTRRVLPVEHV